MFSRLPDDTERQELWFRIVLSAYLLSFSVVLMVSLSSELTSTMTIKKNEDHIVTFEDIPRFSKVRILAEENTAVSRLFYVSHG